MIDSEEREVRYTKRIIRLALSEISMIKAAIWMSIMLAVIVQSASLAEKPTSLAPSRAARSLTDQQPKSPEEQAKDEKIQALRDRAKAEAKNGNWQKSAEYLEQVLECKPSIQVTAPVLEDLTDANGRIGRWGRSETFHRQLAALASDPATSQQVPWTAADPNKQLYLAADCALKQGHFDGAASTLRSIISKIENSKTKKEDATLSDCYFLLGNCLLDGSNNYTEALSLYGKSLSAEERLNKDIALPFRSHRLSLLPELKINRFICLHLSGQKALADPIQDDLVKHIKAFLNSTTQASKPAGAEALALLAKDKLSREDSIRLMETIPLVFTGASGIGESDHLLQRALVMRLAAKPNSQKTINDSYANLIKHYLVHIQYRLAQPYAWLQVKNLEKQHAPDAAIQQAKADWTLVSTK